MGALVIRNGGAPVRLPGAGSRAALAYERPADRPATRPPEARGLRRDDVRLLVTTAHGHDHAHIRDLARLLPAGTLLVVNRSATLPASLPARGAVGEFRLNLSTRYGRGVWLAEPRWNHARPGPLPLEAGQEIRAAELPARLLFPYPGLPRLWFVRLGGDVRHALSRHGEPIRYGYLEPPFPPLDAYQTIFAQVPGSAEMPSAARPFTRRVVDALRARRIELAWVVLHSGVSSLEVGSQRIEDEPFFPEPFAIPRRTAAAVNEARRDRRPVVAVGTTVVRALESAWDGARVRAASGFTRHVVGPQRPPHTVTGLLTGFHDPLASHLALLYALAGERSVHSGYEEAVREGYLWHEFGDSHLIMPSLG